MKMRFFVVLGSVAIVACAAPSEPSRQFQKKTSPSSQNANNSTDPFGPLPSPGPTPSPGPAPTPASMHPVYRASKMFTASTALGPKQVVDNYYSLTAAEATQAGYTNSQSLLNMYNNTSSSRVQILKCWAFGNGIQVHFVTKDPACYGATLDGSLGYLERQANSAAAKPVFRCTGLPLEYPNGTYSLPVHGLMTLNQSECVNDVEVLGYTN